MQRMVLLMVLGSACAGAFGQERRGGATSRSARAARRAAVAVAAKAVENPPAPVLAGDATWTRLVLVGFAALVFAGMVIGPLYRVFMPGEQVPSHSHDEPPGASQRHGPSGERARPVDE